MSTLNWRSLPSLASLRAFDAAARHGTFSEAARSLNVTHAAVAQQVRGLEAELGVPLARRAGRGIALTEQGARLAARLAEGFEAIAAGIDDLRRAENRRTLRISTSVNFADAMLLPRLAEFWRRHPGVEVSITAVNRAVDLAGEGFDLAIRAGEGNWSGLESELLFRTDLIACGAPSLTGDGTPDLAVLPWLFARGTWEEEQIRSLGLDPDRLHRIEIGSEQLEIPMARRGNAMIMSTEIVVREDIAAGRLRAFPLPGQPTFAYHIVTLPGPRRPALTQFVAWLRELGADWRSPASNM